MKTLFGVALFVLTLCLIACSTNSRAVPATSTAQAKPAPRLSEAPSGFDNRSNAVVDDETHRSDQGNFEQFEAVSDGLGIVQNCLDPSGASHRPRLRCSCCR